MANIKELKKRIKSTKNSYKITSAMKLVSAAKLAKAQSKIVGLKPYANELDKTVKVVSALSQGFSHPYLNNNNSEKTLLLVVSSDKGLCGGYNAQLAKKVRALIEDEGENTKVFFMGKKVRDLIKNNVNAGKTFTFEKLEPSINEIYSMADELSFLFTSGEYGQIKIAYNVFKSAIEFEPTIQQVLPMTLDPSEAKAFKEEFPFDFKYEPSPEKILTEMIPEVFRTTVQRCLFDAVAAEHGSRMSAMENATKNCEEMIRTLTLKMNKARQAAITTELIEVVSGAESLNS